MTGAFDLPSRIQEALTRAAEAAGGPVAPVSLSMEYLEAGLAVAAAEASVTRATRSLVFADASLRAADGALVAAGSGVFRVLAR